MNDSTAEIATTTEEFHDCEASTTPDPQLAAESPGDLEIVKKDQSSETAPEVPCTTKTECGVNGSHDGDDEITTAENTPKAGETPQLSHVLVTWNDQYRPLTDIIGTHLNPESDVVECVLDGTTLLVAKESEDSTTTCSLKEKEEVVPPPQNSSEEAVVVALEQEWFVIRTRCHDDTPPPPPPAAADEATAQEDSTTAGDSGSSTTSLDSIISVCPNECRSIIWLASRLGNVGEWIGLCPKQGNEDTIANLLATFEEKLDKAAFSWESFYVNRFENALPLVVLPGGPWAFDVSEPEKLARIAGLYAMSRRYINTSSLPQQLPAPPTASFQHATKTFTTEELQSFNQLPGSADAALIVLDSIIELHFCGPEDSQHSRGAVPSPLLKFKSSASGGQSTPPAPPLVNGVGEEDSCIERIQMYMKRARLRVELSKGVSSNPEFERQMKMVVDFVEKECQTRPSVYVRDVQTFVESQIKKSENLLLWDSRLESIYTYMHPCIFEYPRQTIRFGCKYMEMCHRTFLSCLVSLLLSAGRATWINSIPHGWKKKFSGLYDLNVMVKQYMKSRTGAPATTPPDIKRGLRVMDLYFNIVTPKETQDLENNLALVLMDHPSLFFLDGTMVILKQAPPQYFFRRMSPFIQLANHIAAVQSGAAPPPPTEDSEHSVWSTFFADSRPKIQSTWINPRVALRNQNTTTWRPFGNSNLRKSPNTHGGDPSSSLPQPTSPVDRRPIPQYNVRPLMTYYNGRTCNNNNMNQARGGIPHTQQPPAQSESAVVMSNSQLERDLRKVCAGSVNYAVTSSSSAAAMGDPSVVGAMGTQSPTTVLSNVDEVCDSSGGLTTLSRCYFLGAVYSVISRVCEDQLKGWGIVDCPCSCPPDTVQPCGSSTHPAVGVEPATSSSTRELKPSPGEVLAMARAFVDNNKNDYFCRFVHRIGAKSFCDAVSSVHEQGSEIDPSTAQLIGKACGAFRLSNVGIDLSELAMHWNKSHFRQHSFVDNMKAHRFTSPYHLATSIPNLLLVACCVLPEGEEPSGTAGAVPDADAASPSLSSSSEEEDEVDVVDLTSSKAEIRYRVTTVSHAKVTLPTYPPKSLRDVKSRLVNIPHIITQGTYL